MKYGKPTISWTIPPGSTADMIQFARSLPASPNAFWPDANEESPLKPRQTSWQAGDRFAPGTWYVHVASVTPAPPCPPDADACPDEAVAVPLEAHAPPLLLPRSRAKGAVMTYFAIRGGRISNVKLGRVVFAKYDPFFGLIY